MRTSPLTFAILPIPVIGLLMVGGCASRVVPPADTVLHDDQRLLQRADEAHAGGRVDEALSLYGEAGREGVAPGVRRQALLAAALLHLQPDATTLEIDAARQALLEAHPLFGAHVPLELTSALWLSEQVLSLRTQVADAARTLEGRQVAGRQADASMQATDEEVRSLKKTVRQLRQDLAQKDAALRKAADAVVGKRTPR